MLKFVFILSILGLFHPVHVSLLSLDYDSRREEITLFLKVYADDLKNDCMLLVDDQGNKLFDHELMPSHSVIQEYINARIVLEAGNEKLRSVLVNMESDGEEVRIYSKYKYSGNSEKLKIKNTIMTSLFDDQINLMIFRSGNFEEGFKFTPGFTEIIINMREFCY